MKHLFLLNPIAGAKKFQQGLEQVILDAAAAADIDAEIHLTESPGDARDFTGDYLPGEDVRFYAIGGDGTLNETVNGILARDGYSELALIPCGTGDDFVRLFSAKELFQNVERQIAAKAYPVDGIQTDAGICGINMINIGVDAQTAADVHRFSKVLHGTPAYIASLINRVFLHKLGMRMKVTIDNKHVIEGKFILGSFSNGKYCGGGFCAAPKADIRDGLLEITLVKTLTRLQFIKMVKGYKEGTHLDDPRYADYLLYRRGKTVTIEMEEPTAVCIDGEIAETNHITVNILPKAINFVMPNEDEKETE